MKKFWNWKVKTATETAPEERTLFLNGTIAEDIWISRLFLGDADGFSILYYQNVDSLVYWANQAAYRWGLRGMCMWSLGQEDLRLWEHLPKQI